MHILLCNACKMHVKTWGGKVKIHIRTYGPSRFSSTTDRLVPTKRGVALDGKQFQKLLQCQKRLSIEHYEQTKKLEAIAGIYAVNGPRLL